MRFANLPWAAKWSDRSGARQLVGQCLFDLCVYVPFCYYPVFYVFQGSINEESLVTVLARYKKNCVTDFVANFAFWGPGDVVVFAVPVWIRLPLSHFGGYMWNSILSWMRGDIHSNPVN